MKQFPTSAAGVALIEFALALPLLIILLIGIIETGRLAYYNILVGNAAHAGAFYGSQNLDTADRVSGMTDAALRDGQNIPQISVSPAPTQACQCYNPATGASTALACSLNGSTCAAERTASCTCKSPFPAASTPFSITGRWGYRIHGQ